MNVEVIGRIRPLVSQDSASETNENGIVMEVEGQSHLKSRITGTGFTFKRLYKSTDSNLDVFRASVEPMMTLFLKGFNCCLLVIGERGSGKSFTVSGQNGIASLITQQLATKFEDQMQNLPKRQSTSTRLLSLQMFETTDDSIKDLLGSPSSNSHRLEVVDSAEMGPSVMNLSSFQISNSASAQLKFKQGWANRSRKGAVFVQFELSLPVQDAWPPTRSQFTIVVLPAVQPSSAPSSIRVSQHSVNEKSMLAFSQLIATLANKPFADRAIDYSNCVLTRLLEDRLGGNCHTTALLCFRPSSDPNVGAHLLHLAGSLAKIKNFPVVNNAFLQQLLTQYRARIINALMAPRGTTGHPDKKNTLNDLQTENVDLRHLNEHLQYKLEHLKTTFGSLAVSKTDLSAQLLLTEEEKLKISKTLLDMQIENNKLKEELEAAKFDLNNRIMQLEYSNEELGKEREKDALKARDAQEQLGEVEKKHRELADAYVKLKSEFMELAKVHDEEVNRSDELLNIVDNNIALLEAGHTSERLHATGDHPSKKPLSRESPSRQIELDKKKKQSEDVERELRRKIKEKTQELESSKKLTRETQRKLAEVDAQVITLKNEKLHMESNINRLQHKLKDVNEEFQSRLETYVRDVEESINQTDKKGKKFDLKHHVDAMLNDLKKAHRTREDQLSDAAQDFRLQLQQTVRRHEELLVAYKELRQHAKTRGLTDVDLGPDERALTMADSELKSRQQQEIDRLQSKLANFNKTTSLPDDSASESSDIGLPELKRQMREFTLGTQQELEEERAELLSKNAMLEQEVEELHDYINTHLSRYRDEIMRLRQEGGKGVTKGNIVDKRNRVARGSPPTKQSKHSAPYL